MDDHIRSAARELGYPNMKYEQLDIVRAFMRKRDVFAVLPTGFLCYACLPYTFDSVLEKERGFSLVIVVTPLLAIMKDQVASFSGKGLSSAQVSGETIDDKVKDGVLKGLYQLVFFTPEMIIGSRKWRKMLEGDVYADRLKAFVVDEAHCVKKWGETFRPVLDRIGEVRSLLPVGTSVMALTATATKTIRHSVSKTIGLITPFVISRSPSKHNLVYSVGCFKEVEETFAPLAMRLKNKRLDFPKMIIYCRSLTTCANIYLYLRKELGSCFTDPIDAPCFRLVDMFTSVTDPGHKTEIIQLFKQRSNLRIVVSTIAFGMGVDCPDVRQIVHVGLPDDTCSYIQETGRAGRDGQLSLVTLLQAPTYHPVGDDIKEYATQHEYLSSFQ